VKFLVFEYRYDFRFNISIRSLSLSLSGCGFLGIYHVGVVSCLTKYAPGLLQNRVTGASAGALAAALGLCNADLGKLWNRINSDFEAF